MSETMLPKKTILSKETTDIVNNQNQVESLLEQLTSLVRGIRRSQGAFSLFFVESNLPKQQNAVVQTLQEGYQLNILALNCHDIADKIFKGVHLDEWVAEQIATYNMTANSKTQAVALIGLEQLFPISKHDDVPSIIIEMNWRRNFYRELALPVVLILPSFAIKELATYASDFYDWYSGVYTLTPATEEIENAFISEKVSMKHPISGISSYLFANVKDKKTQINQLKELLDNSNNLSDKAYIYNQLGLLLKVQGKFNSALEHYQKAYDIDKKIGDKKGQGTTLTNIATLHYAKGDFDTALDYLEQSLAIQKDIGDKAGQGATLNNISQIYDAQGDYDTALKYLEQSLAIRKEVGDKAGQGATLNNISGIHYAQGDYDTALNYLKQSLEIKEEIGDKAGQGATLNNISGIHYAQGDYATALNYLRQSLVIREEIGDKAGLCYTYLNLGRALTDMPTHPEHQQAQAYLDKAYQLASELGLHEILDQFNK